jgi:hypothetical protein
VRKLSGDRLLTLADAYRAFSLEELRYDWCCNIREDSRALILAELKRRKVDYGRWSRLGRGRRRKTS